LRGGDHDSAESEVDGFQGASLQDLTPEITIDHEGFPAGRNGTGGKRRRSKSRIMISRSIKIGRGAFEFVKAVDEPHLRAFQRGDGLGEEIGGHEDIGVADGDEVVFGEWLEVNEGGDFGVGAEELRADDEFGVDVRVSLDEIAHEGADGIVGRVDAQENLHLAAIRLCDPTLEAFAGVNVGAFEGLEDGDVGRERGVYDTAVQRKAHGAEKLPENECDT
jgi:hypothetical protein